MYLLDTDTLTHLHAGSSNIIERLKSVADAEVGITIITKVKVLRGRIDYLLKAETSANLRTFISDGRTFERSINHTDRSFLALA
jgi:predicted nucleic acid-binding protein